jgi:hypothetical protein
VEINNPERQLVREIVCTNALGAVVAILAVNSTEGVIRLSASVSGLGLKPGVYFATLKASLSSPRVKFIVE